MFGAMLTTIIICGSLIVGDSIKLSLTKINVEKLGKIDHVVTSGDRYFSSSLKDRLNISDNKISSVLHVRGVSISGENSSISDNLNVYGIDNNFSDLYKQDIPVISEDEVILNRKLADVLQVKKGDVVTLRLEKPSLYPVEAPLSSRESLSITLRLTVTNIVPNTGAGRFSIQDSQRIPSNIFIDIDFLNREFSMDSRSNLMLIPLDIDSVEIEQYISEVITAEDIGLSFNSLEKNDLLISDRIFIDDVISESILSVIKSEPVFSYFINSAQYQNRSTPYSFITTLNSTLEYYKLNDNQIIINSWVAEDLEVNVGDKIDLSFYQFDNNLTETVTEFEVKEIVDIEDLSGTSDLIPLFHGLHGTESCSQWEPGIPVDLDNIRIKDEEYWTKWNNRPKFIISYNKALELWSNGYGSSTGILIDKNSKDDINSIISAIPLEKLGFSIVDIKNRTVEAGMNSIDFTQLFIALSFFLIISSMMFCGVMFSLYVTQRKKSLLTLYALGFKTRYIKTLFLSEALLSSVLGSIIGILFSRLYTGIILNALKTVWNPAIRTGDLDIYVLPRSIIVGFLIGLITTVLAILIELKSITKLLPGAGIKEFKDRSLILKIIITVSGVFSLVLLFIPIGDVVINFLIAGTLLLIFFISIFGYFLSISQKYNYKVSIPGLAINKLRGRPKQSLLIVLLLSCCFFLITTVNAHRKDVTKGLSNNSSGSGGFDYIAETALPLTYNNLEENLGNIDFVPFRVKSGNDFSCLNLNKISVPGLLGVDSISLKKRDSFSLVGVADGYNIQNSWDLLKTSSDNSIIPAFADMAAITWGLSLKLGDIVDMEDERGQQFSIKLVGGLNNSILQGNLIIDEEYFRKLYPSSDGYRVILLDVKQQENLLPNIKRVLRPKGLYIDSTANRLKQFYSVESAYLDIFFLLGALGLILGIVALAIVILRNAEQDKNSTELLKAIGFNRVMLLKLELYSYCFLLVPALVFGSVSSIVANRGAASGTSLILTLVIGVTGFIWVFISSVLITRKKELTSLRRE